MAMLRVVVHPLKQRRHQAGAAHNWETEAEAEAEATYGVESSGFNVVGQVGL
jgi:hypothetical protein